MNFAKIIFIVAGVLSIVLAVLNVQTRKNQWLKKLIGETGYRIINVIVGLALIYIALFTDYLAAL